MLRDGIAQPAESPPPKPLADSAETDKAFTTPRKIGSPMSPDSYPTDPSAISAVGCYGEPQSGQVEMRTLIIGSAN